MVRRVVLAQPLQDLLVVHEPVQRAQEEGVKRQVADLLQLEVPAHGLQPPRAPDARLQRLQGFAVLPQVSRQLLVGARDRCACIPPSLTPETKVASACVASFRSLSHCPHFALYFLISVRFPGRKEKLYESTTRLNTLRDFGVDVRYFRGETGEKEGNKQTGAPSGGLWFSSKCHQMTKRPGPIQ